VLLDCDAGQVSFFFDRLKYVEHILFDGLKHEEDILKDLGCAFKDLQYVDGCESGDAGQGAPSGIEGGR
jgi:hypothetical protein